MITIIKLMVKNKTVTGEMSRAEAHTILVEETFWITIVTAWQMIQL